jgi:hypothetical protein
MTVILEAGLARHWNWMKHLLPLVAGLLGCISGAAALVLTPDQESYFSNMATIDATLWKRVTTSPRAEIDRRFFGQEPGTRFRVASVVPYRSPVCRAWLKNQNLWNGALVGGCNRMAIHPRLNDGAIGSISWKEVDPAEHIDVMRNAYIAQQPNAMVENRSSANPEFYWKRMAPILRRLLLSDQVKMEEATFDANNDGAPDHLYAVTLLPNAVCLSQPGPKALDHTFVYMDGSGPKVESFNRLGLGGEFVIYAGEAYTAQLQTLWHISATTPGTGAPEATLIEECAVRKAR